MNKYLKRILNINITIICFLFLFISREVYAFNCDEIPETIKMMKDIYGTIVILVPILVVVFSTIDFVKAIVAQKDDEMKKAYSGLIKRLIIGVVIIFAPLLINFLLNLFSGGEWNTCGIL